MRHIYLDYASSTPLAPAVQEEMVPFLSEYYGVPAGSHWFSRISAEGLEDARARVATLLNAQRDEIIFTSGATESINLVLKGTLLRHRTALAHGIISTIDHSCVAQTASFLESWDCEITRIAPDSQGMIHPQAIAEAIRAETVLVSVPHVVSDTGVIQPIQEIAAICRKHSVWLHVNAAQSMASLPINVQEFDIDFLSLSGHKMYASKGTGALYIRHGLAIEPLIHGTGHETGCRGGTQHIAGCVGLGRAAVLVRDQDKTTNERLTKLRERLYAGLCATWHELLPEYGSQSARLPGLLCVGFPHISADELLTRANEICAVSMGCSTNLAAMGILPAQARSAIRFSLGWYTTEEEIDRTVAILSAAAESLR